VFSLIQNLIILQFQIYHLVIEPNFLFGFLLSSLIAKIRGYIGCVHGGEEHHVECFHGEGWLLGKEVLFEECYVGCFYNV
jgi:hypothetical protein